MLSTIYWVLAILVMVVLLANAIYMLVSNINEKRQYKKFAKKVLDSLLEEREED
ncbi:hypothetical protein IJE86_01425 [bacterium]|nr:hypothetical protein [bacterium]